MSAVSTDVQAAAIERDRHAPLVVDLIAAMTGTAVEVVSVSGSTRPPAVLPAVRVRVTSVDYAWDSSRVEGGRIDAEVVVYSDDHHPLTLDLSRHTESGARGRLNAGLTALEHGNVLTAKTDGNARQSTLADDSRAILHRLVLRGAWLTVPTIERPGSGVNNLAQIVSGMATRSTSARVDERFGGRRGTMATSSARNVQTDSETGSTSVDVTTVCHPVNGGSNADVVLALNALPSKIVGRVASGMGRCLSCERIDNPPEHDLRGSGGAVELTYRLCFAYRID